MTRLLIVDDEALVRRGLSMVLGTAADIDVVGACDGPAALGAIEKQRPDVVLLDVRMPEVDGLTLLRRIRSRPRPPVVAMLTTFDTDDYITTALCEGAAGYLLKDTEPDQLIHAVRLLASGASALSAAVTRSVARHRPRSRGAERVRTLTTRETDVLRLLALGLSNGEIATRLHLSSGTVKEHISVLLGKLGVGNRVQAAVLAHECGIAAVAADS
ncbi:response regulator [Marinitenerispora sediminis]|uniref:DNA-binding response regulator n=1 Tax=Marinitenerispora sediminis TaxID=1931232 RepID=A0A368SY09_9ACTN|nr:response regulator transcription factor [Marinitenerispora sediminis]RCV48006.1 DNA-binding response regulator [Marinitenerispora sediminis]RCV48044.1 DNA-binding response regulator [Marinitenerispora sediminis]RCV48155.1 DNA-binding response regulator [Marinitenerispora sediminis]